MLRPTLFFVAFLTAACSEVVIEKDDDDGGGGSGASDTSSGSGPTSSQSASTSATSSANSTSSGASCASLEAAFQQAVASAQSCNPFIDLEQCYVVIEDTCACPSLPVNGTEPTLVQAAQDAYAAWVGAGCGPYPCFDCFPAHGGICSLNPDGQTGTCAAVTTF